MVWLVFLISYLQAALENPLKSDHIDFSKLNLNRYIEKKEDTVVEKSQSQEDPDLTVYFVFERKLNEVDRKLIMQVFDFNKDNNMDMANHIKNGKVYKRESALEKDSRVNQVIEYDVTTGKPVKETSLDGSSSRNIWRYWQNGELRLMEMDRNNDKRPDKWVHYRQDKIVRIEEDANFDGKQIKEIK